MARTPAVTQEEILDFTGQEEAAGFDLLPAAQYLLRVREAEVKESERTGHPYVKLQAEVRDDHQEGAYRRRIVFCSLAVKGDDADKTKTVMGLVQQRYQAMTGNPLVARGGAQAICERIATDIIGQTFVGKVTIKKPTKQQAEELGWEPQNNITKFFPAETWEEGTPSAAW